jgi:hypothetical protein
LRSGEVELEGGAHAVPSLGIRRTILILMMYPFIGLIATSLCSSQTSQVKPNFLRTSDQMTKTLCPLGQVM